MLEFITIVLFSFFGVGGGVGGSLVFTPVYFVVKERISVYYVT